MSNSGTLEGTVDSRREKESRITGDITLASNRLQSSRIKNKDEKTHFEDRAQSAWGTQREGRKAFLSSIQTDFIYKTLAETAEKKNQKL